MAKHNRKNTGVVPAAHAAPVHVVNIEPRRTSLRTSGTQRPLACRFSRFAARFSSNDLAGFFLFSFFRSMPLLIGVHLVER